MISIILSPEAARDNLNLWYFEDEFYRKRVVLSINNIVTKHCRIGDNSLQGKTNFETDSIM